MIDLLETRIDSLSGIFVISNTPAYLFKHFRNSLESVARKVPLDRIVAELRQETSHCPSQDIHSTAYAYALFTMMTYWDYQDVSPELAWIRESGLRWIREIVDYYERSNSVISETLELPNIEHLPTLSETPYTTLSTADNNIVPTVAIKQI